MVAQKLLRDSYIIEKEFVTADVALEKRKSMLLVTAPTCYNIVVVDIKAASSLSSVTVTAHDDKVM